MRSAREICLRHVKFAFGERKNCFGKKNREDDHQLPTLAHYFGKRTIEAETFLSFVGVGALDDPFALSDTYAF